MQFRFRIDRAVDKETRRIALSQIDRAISGLSQNPDTDVAIHDCRRCLKRTRSLLRLVRPGLGEERFRGLDRALRDIARDLSGHRDRHVAQVTVAGLELRAGVTAGSYARVLEAALAVTNHRSDSIGTDTMASVARAAASLAEVRSGLADLGRLTLTQSDVIAGCERVYASARRKMVVAYASDDEDSVHEWRKLVQRHWRQLQLLEKVWPAVMAARIHEAQRISELIGEHQDLSVVCGLVAYVADDRRHRKSAAAIVAQSRERQAVLRKAARPHGERLFADGPSGLSRRLECYWNAAASERAELRALRSRART